MGRVKLSPKLPADDSGDNGLDELYGALFSDTDRSPGHLVVGVVRCASYVTDVDTGGRQPSPRFLKIEAVLEEDRELVRAILDRARNHRDGSDFATETFAKILEDRLLDEQTGRIHRRTPDIQQPLIYGDEDTPA